MLKLEVSQDNLKGVTSALAADPSKAIANSISKANDDHHHQQQAQQHHGMFGLTDMFDYDPSNGTTAATSALQSQQQQQAQQQQQVTTDMINDFYMYASAAALNNPIVMADPIYYNWQASNQSSGDFGDYTGSYGFDPSNSAAGGGAAGFDPNMAGEYDYGLYSQQAANYFGSAPAGYGYGTTTANGPEFDLGVPVKMPDAMLYPALDDSSESIPTVDISTAAMMGQGAATAGIFSDYFNLTGHLYQPSQQQQLYHPMQYGQHLGHHHHHHHHHQYLDDPSVVSHVKPTDVISPELFQSMHVPMIPVYGHFQPEASNANRKDANKTAGGSKKKKKPASSASAMYGQSFFSLSSAGSATNGAKKAIQANSAALHPVKLDKEHPLDLLGDLTNGTLPHLSTANNNVPSVIGEDGQIYTKPNYSYAALISRALRECEGSKLTLSGIYDWIKDNFPYYRSAEAAWHNLSLNKCFKKIPRPADEPGKGGFWCLDEEYIAQQALAKQQQAMMHQASRNSGINLALSDFNPNATMTGLQVNTTSFSAVPRNRKKSTSGGGSGAASAGGPVQGTCSTMIIEKTGASTSTTEDKQRKRPAPTPATTANAKPAVAPAASSSSMVMPPNFNMASGDGSLIHSFELVPGAAPSAPAAPNTAAETAPEPANEEEDSSRRRKRGRPTRSGATASPMKKSTAASNASTVAAGTPQKPAKDEPGHYPTGPGRPLQYHQYQPEDLLSKTSAAASAAAAASVTPAPPPPQPSPVMMVHHQQLEFIKENVGPQQPAKNEPVKNLD